MEWNTEKHHESQKPKQWCRAIEYEKSLKNQHPSIILSRLHKKSIYFCSLSFECRSNWNLEMRDFEERAKPGVSQANCRQALTNLKGITCAPINQLSPGHIPGI